MRKSSPEQLPTTRPVGIKKNRLQDKKFCTQVNADDALKAILATGSPLLFGERYRALILRALFGYFGGFHFVHLDLADSGGTLPGNPEISFH